MEHGISEFYKDYFDETTSHKKQPTYKPRHEFNKRTSKKLKLFKQENSCFTNY